MQKKWLLEYLGGGGGVSSLPYISIAYYMQKEERGGPDSMQKYLHTGRPPAICV